MTQLSVVIPTWSGTPELAAMALELCKVVRPMCDELIVTEDAGAYYRGLQEISDLYLMHPNLGDVVNINLGMRVSRGDYVISINSDCEILSGNLRDLCIPDRVVCPDSNSGGFGGFTGGFFMIPRSVLNNPKYGYLDESKQYSWISHGAGADATYQITAGDILTMSDKVKVHHRVGVSYAAKRRLAEEQDRQRLLEFPNREVDPGRHRNRLEEDPRYAELWGEDNG